MERQNNEWMNRTTQYMDGWNDKTLYVLTDKTTEHYMDGWMDGWMEQ